MSCSFKIHHAEVKFHTIMQGILRQISNNMCIMDFKIKNGTKPPH